MIDAQRELWTIERLRAEDGDGNKVKLEIGDSDGIGCRDETIRLLEEKLQAIYTTKMLEKKLVELRPETPAHKPEILEAHEVTEPGDYWWLSGVTSDPRWTPVQVGQHGGELYIRIPGWEIDEPIEGQFIGPLPKPEV